MSVKNKYKKGDLVCLANFFDGDHLTLSPDYPREASLVGFALIQNIKGWNVKINIIYNLNKVERFYSGWIHLKFIRPLILKKDVSKFKNKKALIALARLRYDDLI